MLILKMILHFLYNLGIVLYGFVLKVVALFNTKAQLFNQGRNQWRQLYAPEIPKKIAPRVWVHCASLGEFEQARPIIEALKSGEFAVSVIVTFFSPSGYEVRKGYNLADAVLYLPLDTPSNAKDFITLIKPDVAIFIKYEFWYNIIQTLEVQKIPILSVASIFQDRHAFFKWYGGFQRKMLQRITHFFVQDEQSFFLLKSIGIEQVSVVGDTRFDRAFEVASTVKKYEQIVTFKKTKQLLVVGSSWLEDEHFIREIFPSIQSDFQLLLAPHEIQEAHLIQIEKMFAPYKVGRYTQGNITECDVLVLDTFGMLSSVYYYADVVWIGGGWNRTGIHNLVEAAVYGKPIFFGPNYSRYREANDLVSIGAVASVTEPDMFLQKLNNQKALSLMGNNALKYVKGQLGATVIIVNYLVVKCLSNKA